MLIQSHSGPYPVLFDEALPSDIGESLGGGSDVHFLVDDSLLDCMPPISRRLSNIAIRS